MPQKGSDFMENVNMNSVEDLLENLKSSQSENEELAWSTHSELCMVQPTNQLVLNYLLIERRKNNYEKNGCK